MSVWSVEAVTEFINKYKSHQCLWKLNDPEYKSRNIRSKAYQELVTWCRNIGFKSADRDFVKKKIQSLRGAFRKELRKTLSSLEQGLTEEDAYKSGLWYFDLMLFTKDQEMVKDEDENDDGAVAELSNDGWGTTKDITTVNIRCPYPDSGDESPTPVQNLSANTSKSQFSKNGGTEETQENWFQPAKSLKRKVNQETRRHSNESFYSEITETDAIGITVSRKLARMDRTQALYAETIINTVLRKGLLNKLTEETDVCENQCSKNFL